MKWAALVVLCACGSDAVSQQDAKLGPLHFAVPAAWSRTDWTRREAKTSQWTPLDNERKESLTITRTATDGVIAKASPTTLGQWLAMAQQGLPEVRASEVKQIRTSHGLPGARIAVTFHPTGVKELYHRVHVVVVDDATLVHVMYTARDPDAEHRALELVLDSIHHEEG